ncbi:DUF5695 domain-containing protein [Paenibacillus sp. HB172176]|uniref:DUF5695 domain-containing protein n=1 Tax=Paenibacillus sp. HB172176 TaxID=2493690 RepID=UPI00143AFE13|nr:DUF5695 domain-containing protein [Paenibacillus sp. HB172176]
METEGLRMGRHALLLLITAAVILGLLLLPKSVFAYTLSNGTYNVQTGSNGEITSIQIVGDDFPTNYVMNATNAPQQNTSDHEWLGELMFKYRLGSGSWQTALTQSSSDVRTQSQSGTTATVTYQNSANANGVKNFKLVETYSLVGDYISWQIQLTNTSAQTIEFGDVGLPLPFNEYWSGGNNEQIYETRVVTHSFVGNNGSYLTIGRPSGIGPKLLMIPDATTGAGFEYQDRWRVEEHPGSKWAGDQGGWSEGLNVFYIHSNVIKSTNRGYLPNTSLTLAPGASKTYAFKLIKVASDAAVKDRLYSEGMIDVTVVPGMIVPTNQTAKFDLHTSKAITSITTQYPSETTITSLGTTGTNHKLYSLTMSHLGPNLITVNYGSGEKTVLQFYAIEPIADALQRHATFMVNSTQWNVPGDIRDKAFDDWMMQSNSKRNVFNGYWGWGDDWGYTHGQFLAEKNVQTPVASEVTAVDDYLETTIWTNLMAGHHSDYLIYDFLMPSPNDTPTYRGYAYPHIYNTFFSMYKIAKLYPDLITYNNSRTTYLSRAYNIFKALYDGPVAYNWNTGLMGEQTTPELIKALQDEGMTAQANDVIAKMATKYNNFSGTTYPYGSEYNYDNTGEEAVYTLAKMNGNSSMMSKINTKTRATRGQMPVWYYYADPVTITGENWWNFQYTVSLAGYAMDDWVRNHSASPEVDQRLSYAAKIGNISAINSGQISSDSADIGAVAWTYQAEKGNYPALGLGGGALQNGWRGMSGEADLGLFGAIRILSCDVSVDPIFGLYGYGCDVAASGGNYQIVPKDGVNQKLNLITEKLNMTLERDKYTAATVATAKNYVNFTLKSATPGTAHTTKATFTGLAAGTYQILVNNAAVGSVNATAGGTTTVNLSIGTGTTYDIKLQQGAAVNNPPIVDAGSNMTVTLPATIALSGTVSDDGLPSGGSVTTTWSLQSGPGTASIASAGATSTTATVTVPGTYVFLLTASDSALSSSDTVTVTVNATLPDLIAHYMFSESSGTTAADSSGNGKTGTLNGGASFATGQSGNAVTLNGSNGYVSMPGSIVNGATDITIAAWVKASSLSNWTRIFDIGSGTSNYMFLSPQPGGAGLRFSITTGGNGSEQRINSTTAFPTNVWKHVAVTISGATGRLYVDGVQVATNTSMTLNPSSLGATTQNWIGRSQFSGDPYFNGQIDDFRIYSRALSASEIGSLFGGTTVSDLAPQATASTSYVSSWESLDGLNDGYTPTSSDDRGHDVYGNWNNPGTTQWVQYTWSSAKTISSVDVYWFDDDQGIDLPASYTIQYWNGSAWTNVGNPSGLGMLADQYNTTTFTPVTTTQLRLNITAKSTTSTGIESWRVYGS